MAYTYNSKSLTISDTFIIGDEKEIKNINRLLVLFLINYHDLNGTFTFICILTRLINMYMIVYFEFLFFVCYYSEAHIILYLNILYF